jgi:hypothetical protein
MFDTTINFATLLECGTAFSAVIWFLSKISTTLELLTVKFEILEKAHDKKFDQVDDRIGAVELRQNQLELQFARKDQK